MAKYSGVATLESLEGARRYNNWIISHFLPFIKGPTIEIGAGIGNISQHLTHVSSLYVSDVDPILVKSLKKKFAHLKRVHPVTLDITREVPSKMLGEFQNVLAINVLEHIKNDVAALRAMGALLSDNGRLMLLVPAKQFAYTKLDKSLGHFRRYEKEEMIKKLQKAGFTVEKIYFFNPVGLMGWVVRDKIDRNHTQLKSYQVQSFEILVPILRKIDLLFRPFIGISLIVIAKKI